MTPRVQGRAELEHPSWCEQNLCQLETLPVGGYHQREFPVYDEAGKRIGSVLLRGYASGRVTVCVKSRAEFLPSEWAAVVKVADEAMRVLAAAGRVA